MMTVYLDCAGEDRRLALTLTELVAASVEGLVRRVVLIDRGMSNGERSIGDHCGCAIVAPDELADAIEADRSVWFLWLEPGSRPVGGWIAAIGDHVNGVRSTSPQAARFRPAVQDRLGFLARVRETRTALTDGLLIRKQQAIGLVRQRGPARLADLAKGLATKRLDAELRPKRASG